MHRLLILVCALSCTACVYVEPVEEESGGGPTAVAFVDQNPVIAGITEFNVDATSSSDPDGKPLDFAFRLTDPDGRWIPTPDPVDGVLQIGPLTRTGEHRVVVMVTDVEQIADSHEVVIDVQNRDPQVNFSLCANSFGMLQIDGSGLTVRGEDLESICVSVGNSSDPDGHELTAEWTITDVPVDSTMSVEPSQGMSRAFEFDVAGVYEGQVTVRDAFGGETTSSVQLIAGL